MFKFNNDHIFTGYLKQLLASFNLPTYRVYTKQNKKYKEKYSEESPEIIKTIYADDGSSQTFTRYIPYIKDGLIKEYIYNPSNKTCIWTEVNTYFENKKVLNYTKNLKIKNNIYDSYTHEYLGNYLRFLRDYYDLDLMPLYNCFSNRLCNNILLECDHTDASGKVTNHFNFNSSDSHYKIFMLPVKLFKEYTIAIDCGTRVEMCCGIFGKYQDSDSLFTNIAHDTYKSYGEMHFNQPVLFSKLLNLNEYITEDTKIKLAQREDDLKLFIKIPVKCNSSIVVLEGNYLGWNDFVFKHQDKSLSGIKITDINQYRNHYITNFLDEETCKIITEEDYAENREFKPIGTLQLLMMNTNESYPFADKLVEYLSDNAITHLDELTDNIKRVQEVVYKNTDGRIAFLNEVGENNGLWDSRLRAIIYDNMQKNVFKFDEDNEYFVSKDFVRIRPENCFDNFGYVDKKAEKLYKYTRFNTETNKVTETATISNVDIYPDIYKDQKEN